MGGREGREERVGNDWIQVGGYLHSLLVNTYSIREERGDSVRTESLRINERIVHTRSGTSHAWSPYYCFDTRVEREGRDEEGEGGGGGAVHDGRG